MTCGAAFREPQAGSQHHCTLPAEHAVYPATGFVIEHECADDSHPEVQWHWVEVGVPLTPATQRD